MQNVSLYNHGYMYWGAPNNIWSSFEIDGKKLGNVEAELKKSRFL